MEPASLALSIAALYTTCRDCYGFFTAVKTAEKEASLHLRELEIQQSILKAWGFHWQIQDSAGRQMEHTPPVAGARSKLHEYLIKNPFKAEGVFKTLSALADTLSDSERLVKRYGIQLSSSDPTSQCDSNVQLTIRTVTIEDASPVIKEVRSRLSVLNKFKWALKDRNDFKKLVLELRTHSESLYRLCPEYAFGSMNVYLTMDCLAGKESPIGLKRTSSLASEQADIDDNSSIQPGYKLLASAASLKARVNENREIGPEISSTLESIDEVCEEMCYLGKGLALFQQQVVYVEMRDYHGPPLDLTPEQQRRVQQRQSRRRRARFLKSFTTNDALSPKFNKADFSLKLSKADLDQIYNEYRSDSESEQEDEPVDTERPVDAKLRALIQNFYNTFRGAKLRESVYGLDIAGMIDHTGGEHKGFCSILYKLPGTIGVQTRERPAGNLRLRAPVTLESLLGNRSQKVGDIFPHHVSSMETDRYEAELEIDVAKPILMGYIFSRPDDIIQKAATRSSKLFPPVHYLPAVSPLTPRLSPAPSPYSHDDDRATQAWKAPRPGDSTPEFRGRSPGLHKDYNHSFVDDLAMPGKVTEKIANISGFILDYYQHPAKHAEPTRLYRHAYDVYSLGILLLEIGLWDKLEHYEDFCHSHHLEEDQYERRRWICRYYMDGLRQTCGDIYADVVLRCLMIDSKDDEVSLASERELCARIVADLEGCRA